MKTWALIEKMIEAQGACALVSVVRAEGSVPREAGALMIVTREGYHGSIGGGALEWRAIADAQSMLGKGEAAAIKSHALGPELGQCCGGRVDIAIEAFGPQSLPAIASLVAREREGPFSIIRSIAGRDVEQSFGEDTRRLYLFGAGHVGRALVLALAPLPFDIHWIDSRSGAFPSAIPQNVTLLQPGDPVSALTGASNESFALVMTHSHALDLAIVDAALRHPRIAHAGLIGSATKRARFVKRLQQAGIAQGRIDQLICPIGLPGIASKHPAAIAAGVAAQLLMLDEALRVAKRDQPFYTSVAALGTMHG
jgi:xanthine dehydrogenase accessory factor